MSQSAGSGYCRMCRAQVLTTQEQPSHVLHLIVSILTGGLWLLVWFLLAVLPGAKRCTRCGSQLNKGSQRLAVLLFVALVVGGAIVGIVASDRQGVRSLDAITNAAK